MKNKHDKSLERQGCSFLYLFLFFISNVAATAAVTAWNVDLGSSCLGWLSRSVGEEELSADLDKVAEIVVVPGIK